MTASGIMIKFLSGFLVFLTMHLFWKSFVSQYTYISFSFECWPIELLLCYNKREENTMIKSTKMWFTISLQLNLFKSTNVLTCKMNWTIKNRFDIWLTIYTYTLRSFRSIPFIFSIALSAASCVSKCTNP